MLSDPLVRYNPLDTNRLALTPPAKIVKSLEKRLGAISPTSFFSTEIFLLGEYPPYQDVGKISENEV